METVRGMLAGSQLPRLETQMLLQHVLRVPRSWLIAHDTDPLDPQAVVRFQDLAGRVGRSTFQTWSETGMARVPT